MGRCPVSFRFLMRSLKMEMEILPSQIPVRVKVRDSHNLKSRRIFQAKLLARLSRIR